MTITDLSFAQHHMPTSKPHLSPPLKSTMMPSESETTQSPSSLNDRIVSRLLIERGCRTLPFEDACLMLAQELSLATEDDFENEQLVYDSYQELDMRTHKDPSYCEEIDSEIDMAVEMHLCIPIDDPEGPASVRALGSLFERRYNYTDNPSNLNMAISCYYQSILLAAPDSSHTDADSDDLFKLGCLFYSRFQFIGRPPDISQAISCFGCVVNREPADSPRMGSLLSALGGFFLARHECTGNLEDLEQSVLLQSNAVLYFSDDHPEKPECLSNLAHTAMRRFEALGQLSDIDSSIQFAALAVSLTSNDDRDRGGRLCNLGNSYNTRYQRSGEVGDLDSAIRYHREAVMFSIGSETYPLCQDSLGTSLALRFDLRGQREDIDQAILCHETAVEQTLDGDISRPERLSNLGNAYGRRSWCSNEPADLVMSIQYLQEALELTDKTHPSYVEWLENLGASFGRRFELSKEPEDLHETIRCLEESASLTPIGHPGKSFRLFQLGRVFHSLFEVSGNREDLEKATETFKSVALAGYGSPDIRFDASWLWVGCFEQLNGTPCFDAYKQTMALLPQRIWIGVGVSKQYQEVSKLPDIATQAAYAAISYGEYNLALEWLEQGRSIVWNQMAQRRLPLDDLRAADPKLAAELENVARLVDEANTTTLTRFVDPNNTRVLEWGTWSHHRLAERWEDLVAEARQVPGFHDFLKPKTFKELARAAQDRTVVVVVVHAHYCGALALLPGSQDLIHIPLTTFSYDKAARASSSQLGLLQKGGLRERGIKSKARVKADSFESILGMLWVDVAEPILKQLGYLNSSTTDDLPHVTWCTTGPLAFLPLHAAGLYDVPQSRMFDFVVSSYTPTLTSLVDGIGIPRDFHGLLAVGQTATPDFDPLQGTAEELDQVASYATGLQFTRIDGESATISAVLDAMASHSWVHLACHGSQRRGNPTESAFHLHDGPLDLATIIQKPLPHARVAFLSACQTATGDESMPEESVHLAAGMIMAGYSTVIGTMWSVGDDDAPLIAERVYAEMLKGGTPNCKGAARALHNATEALRRKVGDKRFTAWVPYIHIGI